MSSIILMKSLSLVRKCRFLSAYGGRFPVRAYAAPAPTFEPYVAQSRYLGSTSISDEHPSFEPSSMVSCKYHQSYDEDIKSKTWCLNSLLCNWKHNFSEGSGLWNTCVHESGHAVAVAVLSGVEKLCNATVVPGPDYLGCTRYLSTSSHLMTRKKLIDEMVISMAATSAEGEILGPEFVCTGASGDFHEARIIARDIVAMYGMSAGFGPAYFDFENLSNLKLSHRTRYEIDEEVNFLLDEAWNMAKELIIVHKAKVLLVAHALLKKKTLSKDDIAFLIKMAACPTRNLLL
ncbi:ATP-dependent zinc metalloprotease FTSH 4, mitochondrial-like [Lotus japonicus]|uniref:ATP-dependent zinc metalloprotease FTSH 4, mitochondrial-like n=1 Tax=Lotus japonicus TaxID=34305 RepID=UPI002582C1BA|nr:ATP-dependent zinc metalloprotease FTSH 4, mitochondrial-like [Lotus japonicus]